MGREIHRLHVHAATNRLYVAYGDYGANTGPIDVVSLDLSNLTAAPLVEATLQTEETWGYRAAGAKVYVPYLDPKSGPPDGTPGQLAVRSEAGVWSVIRSVTPVPVHSFAIAVVADGMFLFGAANEPNPPIGGATVWRSTDNGATWTEVLAPRPDQTGNARFYAVLIYGDEMITWCNSLNGGHLYHWSAGGPWAEITDPVGIGVAEAVAFSYMGTPFHLCFTHGKPEGQRTPGPVHVRTHPSDEAQRTTIAATIPVANYVDAVSDGTYLYLLDEFGTLSRGDTGGTWETLFTLDITPATVAVSDGVAYFGTTDSKVYKTALPA